MYAIMMRTSKSPRWSPVGVDDTLEGAIKKAKAHWELTIDYNAYVDIRIERQEK